MAGLLGGFGSSLGGGGGFGDLLTGGLQALFGGGGKNSASAAMPYLNQIPGAYQQHLGPYEQFGTNQLPILQKQYRNLLNNPGDFYNQLGAGYQQSPGYKFQTDQALGAANRAAAAGGMLGSPQEQQNIAGITNQLANQDFNQYLQQVLGIYGQGLGGLQGLANNGLSAATNTAGGLSNLYGSQANLAYAGQNNQNQQRSGFGGSLAGLFGSGLSSLLFG